MSRFARYSVLQAKAETTYGTYVAPGDTDVVFCSRPESTPLEINMVTRERAQPYLGNMEKLPGRKYRKLNYSTEAVGSGTVGTVPAWGRHIRACAVGETATSSVRVDYLPLTFNGSGTQDALSYLWNEDGVAHRGAGGRGDFTLRLVEGERPMFDFSATMLDNQASGTRDEVAAVSGTLDYSGWKSPQVVRDGITTLYVGGTVNTSGAPAITGGVLYPCASFQLRAGNSVATPNTFGEDAVDVVDRMSTVEIELTMTKAQEVALLDAWRAGTAQTVALSHGTVAGRKLMVGVGNGFITNMQPVVNGQYLRHRVTLDCVPISGNDEWRIITF